METIIIIGIIIIIIIIFSIIGYRSSLLDDCENQKLLTDQCNCGAKTCDKGKYCNHEGSEFNCDDNINNCYKDDGTKNYPAEGVLTCDDNVLTCNDGYHVGAGGGAGVGNCEKYRDCDPTQCDPDGTSGVSRVNNRCQCNCKGNYTGEKCETIVSLDLSDDPCNTGDELSTCIQKSDGKWIAKQGYYTDMEKRSIEQCPSGATDSGEDGNTSPIDCEPADDFSYIGKDNDTYKVKDCNISDRSNKKFRRNPDNEVCKNTDGETRNWNTAPGCCIINSQDKWVKRLDGSIKRLNEGEKYDVNGLSCNDGYDPITNVQGNITGCRVSTNCNGKCNGEAFNNAFDTKSNNKNIDKIADMGFGWIIKDRSHDPERLQEIQRNISCRGVGSGYQCSFNLGGNNEDCTKENDWDDNCVGLINNMILTKDENGKFIKIKSPCFASGDSEEGSGCIKKENLIKNGEISDGVDGDYFWDLRTHNSKDFTKKKIDLSKLCENKTKCHLIHRNKRFHGQSYYWEPKDGKMTCILDDNIRLPVKEEGEFIDEKICYPKDSCSIKNQETGEINNPCVDNGNLDTTVGNNGCTIHDHNGKSFCNCKVGYEIDQDGQCTVESDCKVGSSINPEWGQDGKRKALQFLEAEQDDNGSFKCNNPENKDCNAEFLNSKPDGSLLRSYIDNGKIIKKCIYTNDDDKKNEYGCYHNQHYDLTSGECINYKNNQSCNYDGDGKFRDTKSPECKVSGGGGKALEKSECCILCEDKDNVLNQTSFHNLARLNVFQMTHGDHNVKGNSETGTAGGVKGYGSIPWYHENISPSDKSKQTGSLKDTDSEEFYKDLSNKRSDFNASGDDAFQASYVDDVTKNQANCFKLDYVKNKFGQRPDQDILDNISVYDETAMEAERKWRKIDEKYNWDSQANGSNPWGSTKKTCDNPWNSFGGKQKDRQKKCEARLYRISEDNDIGHGGDQHCKSEYEDNYMSPDRTRCYF